MIDIPMVNARKMSSCELISVFLSFSINRNKFDVIAMIDDTG